MRLKINVTASDIALAKKRDCRKCPVARAINRHLGRKVARVHGDGTITIDKKYYDLRSVIKFVEKYDKDIIVRPFSFYIEG